MYGGVCVDGTNGPACGSEHHHEHPSQEALISRGDRLRSLFCTAP